MSDDMRGNGYFQHALNEFGDGRANLAAATLALAYEQRTANLIEWAGGVYTPELRDVINERLGLA